MAKIFGIATLISNLLDAGVKRSLTEMPVDNDAAGATLRLDRDVKHFLDCQATQLGVTRSAVITMILRATMAQSQAEARGQTLADDTSRMLERFHLLMSSFDLDPLSVVELVGSFGVTLDDLRSMDKLVGKMTPALIEFLSTRFFVDRDWLLGRSDYPGISAIQWDRAPEAFCQVAADFKKRGSQVEILFLRAKDADYDTAYKYGDHHDRRGHIEAQAFVPVIRITEKLASGRTLTTYRVGDHIRWNYGRIRVEAKTLILWACRARHHLNIHFQSMEIDEDQLWAMVHKKILPVQALRRPSYSGWYADDYVEGRKEMEEQNAAKKAYDDHIAIYFDEQNWKIPSTWESAFILRHRRKSAEQDDEAGK